MKCVKLLADTYKFVFYFLCATPVDLYFDIRIEFHLSPKGNWNFEFSTIFSYFTFFFFGVASYVYFEH